MDSEIRDSSGEGKEGAVAVAERRDFLKTLGIGAAAAAAGAATLVTGRPLEALGAETKTPHYGMLIDLTRCTGCKACEVACKSENNVPLGVFRRKVNYLEYGSYPKTGRAIAPILCNHCDAPPCVEACPVDPITVTYNAPDGTTVEYVQKATYKRPDGLVLVNNERCIGCQQCVEACPYGARYVHPYMKAGGDPDQNGIGKCDYCVHRLDQGIEPSCANTCVGRAIVFGEMNDPGSEISKRLKGAKTGVWKPEAKTKPNTYYIALDKPEVLGEGVNARG